jgi:NAD(P)-dependent dehydrogenase (short-subunit alcohol dehydrogenase family)
MTAIVTSGASGFGKAPAAKCRREAMNALLAEVQEAALRAAREVLDRGQHAVEDTLSESGRTMIELGVVKAALK